jgi:hypothetical protein
MTNIHNFLAVWGLNSGICVCLVWKILMGITHIKKKFLGPPQFLRLDKGTMR